MKHIRAHTKILVALGDCAVTGNVPAMRSGDDTRRLRPSASVLEGGVGSGALASHPTTNREATMRVSFMRLVVSRDVPRLARSDFATFVAGLARACSIVGQVAQ